MKRLQVYPSPEITVTFDPNVCVHSGVCARTLPGVFDVRRKQWIDVDRAGAHEIALAIDRCPSGALAYYRNTERDPSAKYQLTKAVLVNRVALLAAADEPREARARGVAGAMREARGYQWVGLYDVLEDEIVAVAWTGEEAPAHPRFPRTHGLNGAVVATRQPVVVNDVSADPRYLDTLDSTRAEMVVPVFDPASGEIVGTIDAASDRIDSFHDADVELAEACVRAAARLWDR